MMTRCHGGERLHQLGLYLGGNVSNCIHIDFYTGSDVCICTKGLGMNAFIAPAFLPCGMRRWT